MVGCLLLRQLSARCPMRELILLALLCAPVAALRLPAAALASRTHRLLAARHAATRMADEAEEMKVEDFLALATPEEQEQAKRDKEARLQARAAGEGAAGDGDGAAGEGDASEEELEQARREEEARLARIAAVNKGQVTGGETLLGKAFTVVLLAGVFAALILVVGDPQNCQFLPTTKDFCMARPLPGDGAPPPGDGAPLPGDGANL